MLLFFFSFSPRREQQTVGGSPFASRGSNITINLAPPSSSTASSTQPSTESRPERGSPMEGDVEDPEPELLSAVSVCVCV